MELMIVVLLNHPTGNPEVRAIKPLDLKWSALQVSSCLACP